LSVVEQAGLSVSLGSAVLRMACWAARSWLDAGLLPGPVAVNVSAKEIGSGQLPAMVREALEAAQLPPHYLMLELTETALGANPATAQPAVEELHAMGVQLALDDFGTGLSSLSRLQRLPVSLLKIDGSFTRNLGDLPECQTIVSGIVSVAKTLHIPVLAEGVETHEDLRTLSALGCYAYQGYLEAPPLVEEDMTRMLTHAAQRRSPGSSATALPSA
jgi:EAL domain-containing protein (putative c-di-GMP-specific phosphodiesterase class I)